MSQETTRALTIPAGRSWGRQVVLNVATRAVRPVMGRRAKRLLEASPNRRLHLGCAHTILHGWVNIDLLGRVPAEAALDVTRPLPFSDASVEAIFTEHMVEHLTYGQVFALAQECARVLRPSGVLRIVVPDFDRYLRSYVEGDEFIETMHPGQLTPLIGLASVAYGYAHRSIWDAATLISLLEQAGLRAEKSRFGVSRIDPCPDRKERAPESLYVEAIKDPADTRQANGTPVS